MNKDKNIRVIPKKHRDKMIDAAEDFYRTASKLEKFVYNDKICPKKVQQSLRNIYLELHANASYLGRLSMIGC
jgi:hypothetical protein